MILKKASLANIFSLEQLSRNTIFSNIFNRSIYYIANYCEVIIYRGSKCRIFRLNTINNTTCLLFDNIKEPYYTLIGLYPDGVLLAAENQLIYTDFDFLKIRFIFPYQKRPVFLIAYFHYKSNIYYGSKEVIIKHRAV